MSDMLISRPFFRRSNRGPCALSHAQPSSPSPRNLGHGLSCAGACPPAPCSRCRVSPWPLRYAPFGWSVSINVRALWSYSSARALRQVHTLLPDFFGLVGIHVALPSPALDHRIELFLGHLRVRYIHLAPFLCTVVAYPVCNIRRWRVMPPTSITGSFGNQDGSPTGTKEQRPRDPYGCRDPGH